MIEVGERVKCIDRNSDLFGEKGTFTGWLANGLKVKFDNGKTGLYLPCDLETIKD